MATALVDIYSSPLLYHHPFVETSPPPSPKLCREEPPLPDEASALMKKIQEIEKALDTMAIDPSTIAPVGSLAAHHAISNLGRLIKASDAESTDGTSQSAIGAFLIWMKEKIIAIATAIYKIAFSFFRSHSPAVTIEAILDELKLCQAITPSQYETVLQLSLEPEKKAALILLTTLLGFSTTELSPLLAQTLNTSPEYAFSLLLECFLIKKFSSCQNLKALLSDEDRLSLSKVSFEGLQSKETIKEQLLCLRSVSYRSTIQSWVAALPSLLQTTVSPDLINTCTEDLKNHDPQAFVSHLSPLLSQIASQPVSIESLYAKELLSFFSSNFTFERFATEIRHQRFISQWGEQLSALKKAGKALIATHTCTEIAHSVLSHALSMFKKEQLKARYVPSWTQVCPTFRATQEGSFARNLRKIEGLTQKLAVELRLPGASAEALKPSKHILHLACSCGGGHSNMVKALTSSLGQASSTSDYRFSTDKLDVPKEVTRPLDFIYNLFHTFGLEIDTTEIYNFLLKHDLCSVIEFLKWLTSGDSDKATTEKKQSLIRQAILTRDPDFLNMVYAFDGKDLDDVSQQLGLPLLYVATDLDLDDWRRNPTSPFFKEAVPTLQHPEILKTLHLPRDQVEEIGLCVGPEFENKLSPQQVEDVKRKYGIQPDEKVVVFSNGGTALQNAIPERIALEYTDSSQPIHLIVICGTNKDFEKYLTQTVLPRIPAGAPVKMTVLGFQQRAEMAELTQLADVVIGKPGGMSTMEFVKSGTKVIFDETKFRLRWERFNADVVVNSGRGVIMKDPDQLFPLIKESLKSPRRTPMAMAQVKASERYVGVVNRLLTSANRPAAEQGWKEKRKSWHNLNKRMAAAPIG